MANDKISYNVLFFPDKEKADSTHENTFIEVDKKTGEKKYDAAVGTKGYRWLESEMVKELGKEDCIDRRYYDALVDAAATDISKYGDFEWFVSEDPYVSDTPPWFGPGEPHEEDSAPFDVR